MIRKKFHCDIFPGAGYCQLIRHTNKDKRLAFVSEHPNFPYACGDVIFTDESSIAMEQYVKRCARRKGEKPAYKPRPKHPLKVINFLFIQQHKKHHLYQINHVCDA